MAVHVVDAVEARLEGASESWAQLGGHRLGGDARANAADRRLTLDPDLWAEADTRDPAGQAVTFRDLLLGSAFHLVSSGEGEAMGPRLRPGGDQRF